MSQHKGAYVLTYHGIICCYIRHPYFAIYFIKTHGSELRGQAK